MSHPQISTHSVMLYFLYKFFALFWLFLFLRRRRSFIHIKTHSFSDVFSTVNLKCHLYDYEMLIFNPFSAKNCHYCRRKCNDEEKHSTFFSLSRFPASSMGNLHKFLYVCVLFLVTAFQSVSHSVTHSFIGELFFLGSNNSISLQGHTAAEKNKKCGKQHIE
jgi:hypothetical protein